MNEVLEIRKKLDELKNEEKAIKIKRYLKSPYEFYGINIPELRKISKNYRNLEFDNFLSLFNELFESKNHEEMSLALFLMEYYFNKNPEKSWIFLMNKLNKIKTWDHADEVATAILGKILLKNLTFMKQIKEMSKNKNPWIRRIAIVSNLPLIKKNKIELTLIMSEYLVYDEDVYVQKGVGWMLREAGKKDRIGIRNFILNHLDMKSYAFSYSTEKMLELREIRKEKIKKKN
ncbi:DNA alkylation repair protein [Candidatus Woesearchaeota archaeon]|nr:DNA alkylation repair protein [Candidatus Woesearchaeota archaeon]